MNTRFVTYRSTHQFYWPRNVVKRGLCYQNVCPSVCLSVTLVTQAHRPSQDFLWGCTFVLTKNLMTFCILVITLSYMVMIYVVIYCHQVPFISSHQIRPHLCLSPTKMPRKIFLSSPCGGGDAPAPRHPPWLRLFYG